MAETTREQQPLSEPARELVKLLAKIAVTELLDTHFNTTENKEHDHEKSSDVCKI